MNFSFFLARRFFTQGNKGQKASVPAIKIATAGIAVGLAVMIISVCVVKGFQAEIHSKLTGFASHIEIMSPGAFNSPEASPVVTDTALINRVKGIPGVKHVQRISEKIGVLKTHDDFSSILLKGIAEDYDVSFLQEHLVAGILPNFSAKKSSNQIVISRAMAETLGLKIGDKVYTYFFEKTIKQRRLEVTGIYDTHIRQFDKTFALTDLYTVNRLNSWQPEQSSGLEVHLTSMDVLDPVHLCLARMINGQKDAYGGRYEVLSIKENPRTSSILSWLELLDMNVLVILILMVCVAGITMVSGLLILILERISTIGLLKALGTRNARVRHTFLWFAALIVIRGLFWGNIIGLGIVGLQAATGIVTLNPETYYVDTVPVLLNPIWILALNAATLLITMAALVIPSFMVSKVQPAKAIRYE